MLALAQTQRLRLVHYKCDGAKSFADVGAVTVGLELGIAACTPGVNSGFKCHLGGKRLGNAGFVHLNSNRINNIEANTI